MNHSLTRLNYNRLSPWYDWFSFPEQKYKEIAIQLLNISAGEAVLEIGCGTGHSLISLASAADGQAKVYGIDLSDGMFHVAQGNISHAKLSHPISLQVGDALKLPFKSGFFDAIFLSFTLELFDADEISLVLEECKRVLRTDGRIGLVALEHKDCLAVKIYNWFHVRMPAVVDCHPIDARNIMETSGLKIVDIVEKVMSGLPVVMLTARKYG